MFAVIECITHQHHHGILLLAALNWLVGSVGFFLLLRRASNYMGMRRQCWLAATAVAAGTGIWATHFIAMLAYNGPMPISFGIPLTILSAVAAIALFWIALLIRSGQSVLADLAAAAVATAGVAIMHFIGMAAIIASARIHYDPVLAGQGMAVTFIAFTGAFLLFRLPRGTAQIALAAAAAIVAVCSLHFTAMAATTLIFDPAVPAAVIGQSRTWLIGAIAAISMALIIFTGIAAFVDRYLTDLHGLTDATLEGLIIAHQDRILDANGWFSALVGAPITAIIGSSPDRWLVAADGTPVTARRDGPVEAMLWPQGRQDKILEIGVNRIEFRGKPCHVIAIRDLTDRKQAQRQVEHMARHDALTGLLNRAVFNERLNLALERAGSEGEPLALLALDLDRFKAVNDIFGHAQGDLILCRIAAILENAARDCEIIARIGGDEFMILQTGQPQPAGAECLVARILAEIASEMNTAHDPTAVHASIGVAIYPSDALDAATLRHGADVALYRAKESGRGIACFFDQGMDRIVKEKRALEHDLRHAILRNQLMLAYQPLVSSEGQEISGYEALLRWNHPDRGLIYPEQFIPIAEDCGAIVPIGEWVLREACRAAAQWDEHLWVAVNVSAVQFQVAGLPSMVRTILAEEGLAPSRLELEITESVLMKDRRQALATLRQLKDMGVRIVMDDFGTGYSSLNNLQSFPFDKIKIDRSFVGAIEDDQAARSIIRAIVGIGRSLDLPVVAEGVETETQRRMIVEEGCLHAQGYLWGRPGAAPESARNRRSTVA